MNIQPILPVNSLPVGVEELLYKALQKFVHQLSKHKSKNKYEPLTMRCILPLPLVIIRAGLFHLLSQHLACALAAVVFIFLHHLPANQHILETGG